MNYRPHSETSVSNVCPVVGDGIVLSRDGRKILSIPRITFGDTNASTSCTAVVGPNGAGKSLLVRVLCDLSKPDTGSVTWAGQPPKAQLRHKVGLMLQKPVLFRRGAQANLTYALRQTGLSRAACQAQSMFALEQAGLDGLANVQAHKLSGGEQQRLALARALLLKPDILFLDEATANVDPSSTLHIEQQLQEAMQAGLIVVLVSHDQGQVHRMADNVLLMHKGCIVEHTSKHQFFHEPCEVLTKQWIAGELLV